MAPTKNFAASSSSLVVACPSSAKPKKRCRRSATSNKKSRDRLRQIKAARKNKVQVLEEELELSCRRLSHVQRQYNEAQDSLQDQIELRAQLEDDLTDARSRILELEEKLSMRRKEKKILSKLVLQLQEENYRIKNRQLRSHSISTTPKSTKPKK